MRRRKGWAALVAVGLAGCTARHRQPVANPRYVIGAPYEADGAWRYPREDFGYEATGLAVVEQRGPGLTADGERYDPSAMVAAHPTLQLPAVVGVTDLDTGREVRVRVDDRGPAAPGRLIALSPGAARVLGMGEVARVRVRVEAGASEALRDRLGGAPVVAVGAPVGAVRAEALAPPPGVGVVAQVRRGRDLGVIAEGVPVAAVVVPDRLPGVAVQGVAEPGGLWVEGGVFDGAQYAGMMRTRLRGLGARVERVGRRYRVRAGPFGTVAAADAALDQAMRDGVSSARISAE